MMRKTRLSTLLLVSGFFILAVIAVLLLMGASDWQIFLASALAVAAALWHIYYRLNQDLEQMTSLAKSIRANDDNPRFGNMGIKELEDLGVVLNHTLDSLDDAISHLAVHREELRLLLGSIADALWSQDYEGVIQWANEPFRLLFPSFDPQRRQLYWEVIRDPKLLARIREAETPSDQPFNYIHIGGHSYILFLNRNEQTRRRVFIMHNMDAIQQASQMKKDFIVNLTHELRTPLTAIKGFTEDMQDTPEKDHSRHQKIILSHTNRLIHLIRDLEQLSRLEGTYSLVLKDISLVTFFANIRLILEPEVQEKGLRLVIELDPALPRLVCDPFRLEQVFINLVQNSLRYTDSGSITIRSHARDKGILFEVIDTGTGIAREHQDRIFERFYVADPSRNRSLSGTGLGLAIVKHIVLLHQGEITLESEPGAGTTFRISLPLRSLEGKHSDA